MIFKSILISASGTTLAWGIVLRLVFKKFLKDVPPGDIEHDDPLEDLEESRVEMLADHVAAGIENMRMALPASMILDVLRPLAFWGSQLNIVLAGTPIARDFMLMGFGISRKNLNLVSAFMRKRENIKKLVERLEQVHATEVDKRRSGIHKGL